MSQCSQLHPSGGDRDRRLYLHPFLPTYESSPHPCAIYFSSGEEGSSGVDNRLSPNPHQEIKEELFLAGSDSPVGSVATSGDSESSEKDGQEEECRWMSSKMRFMRKMTGRDKIGIGRPRKSVSASNDHLKNFAESSISHDNDSSPNGFIRVCSECNTTKTPLWRSGPCGPKSLCNACGIRQRKARRAMAAAAVTNGLIPTVAPVIKARKPKKSAGACAVPFKKRFKCFTSAESRHKLHCDEITIALSKSSTLPGVFPQDEKEAAILLMALSCGLIRG